MDYQEQIQEVFDTSKRETSRTLLTAADTHSNF